MSILINTSETHRVSCEAAAESLKIQKNLTFAKGFIYLAVYLSVSSICLSMYPSVHL
jgi:hypothetical protein